MVALTEAARTIDADERTFRRAIATGAIHFYEASPRKRMLDDDEVSYLRGHWQLLSTLRRALRTEPNVRVAVLYGSAARGDDRGDSDVDVLVALAEDRPDAAVKLAVRLERALGRAVDVARLNRIEQAAPLLLQQVVEEGRVIVDRDREWAAVLSRRAEIERRARASHAARRREAAAALRALEE